jgi:Tfp pilus assembly major pilin PilA
MEEKNTLIPETIKNENNFWMVTTILLVIIVLIGAFIGYKYGNFDGIDGRTLKSKYIEKSKIHFDDLSYDIRSQYINRNKIEYSEKDKIKSLESKSVQLENEIEELKKELVLAKTKTGNENPFAKADNKKRDLTKVIEDSIDDVNDKGLLFVKQTTCNDMIPGRYSISNECRDNLKKFISEFNQDYTFEIIPTVNDDDFVIISKFRELNEKLPDSEKFSKDRIDLLNKYANTGLGKYRSNEIGWLIRQTMGKDVNLKYVPYHIHAKDDRGIIVKVYR